jgi:UDP-N-acetylenolpyruvoylglucosamine reductase
MDDANASLDGILSAGARPMVRAHDLRLANREVASEADVEALVAEIREQLLAQVRAGSRVRIV